MKANIIFCILSLIFGGICVFFSLTSTIIENRVIGTLLIFFIGALFGDSFMCIVDSFLRRDYGDRRNKN
jgi:4-hydroxybenzoate polyprenyltransferase